MPLVNSKGGGFGAKAKAKAPASRSGGKAKPTPKAVPKKATRADSVSDVRKVDVSTSPKEKTVEIRQIENGYVVRESWREKTKGKDGPSYDYKSKETFTKTPPKIIAE